jgi:hypothetical protein
VHIETCVPYTESYSIRSFDKTLLILYMIKYLLSKHAPPDGINYPNPELYGVYELKMRRISKLNSIFYTPYGLNDLETSYPRYPMLNKYVDLLSDKKHLAFEYIRICGILRNVETPFQVDVFKELSAKSANNFFPNTTIAIDSTVGRMLTRSYPYRLDMPLDIETNMETFITKARAVKVEDKGEGDPNAEHKVQSITSSKREPQHPEINGSKERKVDDQVGGINPGSVAAETQDPSPAKAPEEPVKALEEPVEVSKEPVEVSKEPAKVSKEPVKVSKEPAKGPDGPVEAVPQTPQGSPIFDQHIITFIKDEILQKLGTANYFGTIKNVLINIVKVNDPTYDDGESVKDEAGTESSDIKSIITTINKTHDVFNDKLINLLEAKTHALDPMEVYLDKEMKKTSATTPAEKPEDQATTKPEDQATTKPEDQATTKPEDQATTKPEDQATTKPEDQATTKPEDQATTKPEDQATTKPEDRATTKPEDQATTKPEGQATTKPEEPAADKTDPPKPAVGGGQKKHKFEGRFYNVHEHRGIKYIITKSYGIIPVYS